MSAEDLADALRGALERIEELERWRDELAERLGKLESDMRGVNEWVANTAQVADDDWGWDGRRAPELDADTYRDVEIQSGDR